MSQFLKQTPGIGGLDEITDAEALFLQNLNGLIYSAGDILYHNGSDLVNLGIGTAGQILQTNSGATAPEWVDSSAEINLVDDTTPQLGGQLDVNGNAIGDGTLELLKFSETASAVNEITIKNAATTTAPEIQATGDDTNIDLKLVPKGTGIVKGELKRFMVRLLDKDTDNATGTGIGGDYRIANRAITVKAVGAYVDTVAATGTNLLTIDINEAGTTILSTKITIDVGEKTSTTAATAPVISDNAIAADAIITFDVDQVNETTPAKGLVVWVDYVYA